MITILCVIIGIVEKIRRSRHCALKVNKQVGAVFFDIRKAFDSVPHDCLLAALAKVGVSGKLYKWFENYLSNRKQRVVLDGSSSAPLPVTSGIPQGSILGPLLFIVFMNSITEVCLSQGSRIVLYADDILLYKPLKTPADLQLLQQDVNSVLNWIYQNGLSPNHSKTKLLNITRSRQATTLNIVVDGHQVHESESVVYLGVTLNSTLTWTTHINKTCRAATRSLGMIHRKLYSAPQHVRHKIYTSVVLPKLDYCCSVWDPHLIKNKQELDKVQKFAGRVITHDWKSDLPTLQNLLKWKDLTTRRKFIKLKVCYKIIMNRSLIPSSSFSPHPHPSPRHPHCHMLFKPLVRSNSHLNSFFIDVITYWNRLPAEVVNAPSTCSFKSRLLAIT